MIVIDWTDVQNNEDIIGLYIQMDLRYMDLIPLLMDFGRHQDHVTYKM